MLSFGGMQLEFCIGPFGGSIITNIKIIKGIQGWYELSHSLEQS